MRLSLKPPYVGHIFVRLWDPDYKPPKSLHHKKNFNYGLNKETAEHSNYADKAKAFDSQSDHKKSITPPQWSTSYCQKLIEQNEMLLAQGKRHAEQLENLTHLVTQGITTLHEGLKCLNLQIHQVMTRMDQLETNNLLKFQLNQKDIFNQKQSKNAENSNLTNLFLKPLTKMQLPQAMQSLEKEPEAVIMKEKSSVLNQSQSNLKKRNLSTSPANQMKKQKITIPSMNLEKDIQEALGSDA